MNKALSVKTQKFLSCLTRSVNKSPQRMLSEKKQPRKNTDSVWLDFEISDIAWSKRLYAVIAKVATVAKKSVKIKLGEVKKKWKFVLHV